MKAHDDSWGCHLLHVDMDAFFASVAIRDRPELWAVPVGVGGASGRGVVLAANYPARAYGVRSGMPMRRARRLCPHLVPVSPDYSAFEAVSTSLMELFARVSPLVEAASMEEAFLDVSGAVRRLGSPRQIAERLRAQVADEQRITCSVGVASAVSVAKLASRRAKPDGVLVVAPDRVVGFLHPLDVGELWGVGEKTRAVLHGWGLRTVGDLAHTPRAELQRRLGGAAGAHLHDLAWGTDRTTLTPRRPEHDPERSMGAEETFGHDTDDPGVLRRELLRLSAKVARRMRTGGLAGRTVALRLRYADFTTLTRSRTLAEPTDVTAEIYAAARILLGSLGRLRMRVRLVGVRVEGLIARTRVHHQLAWDERERGWPEADRAVDRAMLRFGPSAVRRATLLDSSARGP